MAQYIDKDALIAEIERKRNDYINSFMTEQVHVLNDVLDFLDTIETKQVNLDAELEHYKAEQNIKYEEDINMFEFAKHFFELGVRKKKEEKYEVPSVSKTEDVSVTSRMAMIDDDLKPIAEFILDYAGWNLHKDEWNHPVLEVPLFRVLDALIQRGKPYCGKN